VRFFFAPMEPSPSSFFFLLPSTLSFINLSPHMPPPLKGAFKGQHLSARYSGSSGALQQIIAKEGVRGLYRAYWIHQATWCPFNGKWAAKKNMLVVERTHKKIENIIEGRIYHNFKGFFFPRFHIFFSYIFSSFFFHFFFSLILFGGSPVPLVRARKCTSMLGYLNI